MCIQTYGSGRFTWKSLACASTWEVLAKAMLPIRPYLVMKKAGAVAGVVALSGDIKTFGRLPDGGAFPVGIQHPRKEGEIIAEIDLQDEAISTAGDYERFFEKDGIRYHHILDPHTLHPARGCQSVSVIAKEGIWATVGYRHLRLRSQAGNGVGRAVGGC